MAEETNDPAETTADDAADRTREGFAHADHVESAAQSRDAQHRWGANSPGQNTMSPTGDSDSPDETEKRPSEA